LDPAGTLWLFGGDGYDSAGNNDIVNDLWSFNTTTSQWTWMGGPNVNTYKCSYGTIGVPSPSNLPPVRRAAASWIGSNGTKYFFGGFAADCSPSFGLMNEFWTLAP
jgi:hypothetical protein